MMDPNTTERDHSENLAVGSQPFRFFGPRTPFTDIVQGILVGAALAIITFYVIAHSCVTRVNGWTTMYGCGEPENSILQRGACSAIFRGPINVPQEAMYWTTRTDGAGRRLSGRHGYVLHFPPGRLPPNHAFWSLTMADVRNRFVPNPISRYSVSDRSGLTPNPDGSVDIYIQHDPPAAHTSNWLPAPSGRFLLWLRVYLPGPTILNGEYRVPPVVESH